MADTLRIAVVDKYPIFRAGVVQALLRQKKMDVVGEGASAKDAENLVREHKPDVLLVEIAVPDCLQLVRALVRERPSLKVIVLASAEDEDHAVQALQAGVHGYIMKGITGLELAEAVRSVCRGVRYITPELAWQLVTRSGSAPVVDRGVMASPSLNVREQQVLDYTLKGLTNIEIARILGLGLSTIKYYKTILYRKMRVRNRVEVLVKATAPR
jgi:DNA-binding NarL/FixJ family response regulator